MVALRLRVPVTAVRGETAPVVWVLHDGKPGMASQALGLAEATGFAFAERRLAVRPPWTWLPPQLWLLPLRVACALACGQHGRLPARAALARSGYRLRTAERDAGIGDPPGQRWPHLCRTNPGSEGRPQRIRPVVRA